MKKDCVVRIKEKIIEITPEEADKYMGNSHFICYGNVVNYDDLISSKIRENEIGYIIENRIRKRLIVRGAMDTLGVIKCIVN